MRCHRHAMSGGSLYFVILASAVFTAALAVGGPARAAGPCATGTRCLAVDKTGAPTPQGTYTAQCSGRFPDFVTQTSMIPAGGPWFKLAQNYPSTVPPTDAPWLKIDFKNGVPGANDYLYALRDYSFDGMIAADFQPENNKVRPWFHMPLMNFGTGAREPTHGLTEERPVAGPELGLKPGVTIHNFAVGFYNAAGGYAIGQVWHSDNPDLSKSRFAEGAMTFKILFSDVTGSDFQNGVDLLAGAPEWTIATTSGPKKVRLMQMDVGTVDDRSPTGWVFGTFAFDASATDPVSWNRLRPVGLSWGNDPGYTPADQKAGKKLTESTISDQIPAYAAAHLGWAGRTNGPVDNPISGCLSCHGTAQYPVNAALAPFDKSCATDAQKMQWFRNLKPGEAFGSIDKKCNLVSLIPPPVTLDFSLQIGVSVQSALQFHDVNSCTPPTAALKAAMRKVRSNPSAARIHR